MRKVIALICTLLLVYSIAQSGTIRRLTGSSTQDLLTEAEHVSYLFPEEPNETVTFTAHGSPNTFSAYTEIVDNDTDTLSTKISARGLHISSILVENTSVKDKVYILEISYGDTTASNIISLSRYMSGNTLTGTIQQVRLRAPRTPYGQLMYWRLKCETGAATVRVHFRYHSH